jgi:4-hydroxy-tetrahydrodipicolinate reductase
MKIGLIGYGKMGKAIEKIAKDQGHEIVFALRGDIPPTKVELDNSEVCIEFTGPESAFTNLKACIDAGKPVISGTTGWLDKMTELENYCKENNGAFFYASNFSVGVNIFFTLNEQLARIMNQFEQYDITMEEIHHTAKKDAPSGTAISILDGIIENNKNKSKWHLGHAVKNESIPVNVKRTDPTPGTHSVTYYTSIDAIEIKHTAHSRDGFAQGSLTAAQWLIGKTGVFGMKDMLKF